MDKIKKLKIVVIIGCILLLIGFVNFVFVLDYVANTYTLPPGMSVYHAFGYVSLIIVGIVISFFASEEYNSLKSRIEKSNK